MPTRRNKRREERKVGEITAWVVEFDIPSFCSTLWFVNRVPRQNGCKLLDVTLRSHLWARWWESSLLILCVDQSPNGELKVRFFHLSLASNSSVSYMPLPPTSVVSCAMVSVVGDITFTSPPIVGSAKRNDTGCFQRWPRDERVTSRWETRRGEWAVISLASS